MLIFFRLFIIVLCAASLTWAGAVLWVEATLRPHRPLVQAIQQGTALQQRSLFAQAFQDYRELWAYTTCYQDMSHTLAAMHIIQSDDAARRQAWNEEAMHLNKAKTLIDHQLRCAPMDAKAWLNRAIIITLQEGLNQDTQEAYIKSQRFAPHEAWLVEKRLDFALPYLELFDLTTRSFILQDLHKMNHIPGRRQYYFLKRHRLKNLNSLLSTDGT